MTGSAIARRETASGPVRRLSELALRYQLTLNRNPRDPAALLGMSMVALASRQTQAAVHMAEAAVAAAPRLAGTWIALGQALRAASRTQEAEQAYLTALGLDGTAPLACVGLGELKLATGRAREALCDFDFALRRNPALAAAHLAKGYALQFLNSSTEALACYDRARELEPRLPEAEFGAGFALSRLGHTAEAERHYRRAIVLRPDFAAAWMNLGCLLRDRGRALYAEAALRRALALRPDLISGWINLAVLEREYGRAEDAERHLRAAFELNPAESGTHIAWAQFCSARHDLAGAWGWLRWALAHDPGNDEALNQEGILLHNEGNFADAILAFERAEAAGNGLAASNRGNSLLDLGRMDEALRAHEEAAQREPASAGARYNLALTQLRLGDWTDGWANYEARWRFREVHRYPRCFTQPRWTGEQMRGTRILLHGEQGLGDTIQFCRYAALVAARGGYAILQVQKSAARLLQSLAVVRSGAAEVALLDGTPPPFDLECPLMSLAAVFHTQVDTAPWTGAYLGADAKEIAARRAAFPTAPSSELRVGIAWAGNPSYKSDHQRSVALTTLLPLLRTSGITWISLQKGAASEQLAGLPAGVCVADGCSADRDLAETAALLATLDLVITTDTCIAHLAGAMAKPVWILLPHLSDWRWMQERSTTPWYPTAQLVRQSAPNDWEEVMARVSAQLLAFQSAENLPDRATRALGA